jgi:hypothetical protein
MLISDPHPLTAAAAQFQNRGHHPREFYRKVGFPIVGVLADANRFEQPGNNIAATDAPS